MEATKFHDPLFGELTWDSIERKWLGKARLDELLDFGAALPDAPDGLISDAHDPQALFKEGAFRLVIRPGDGQPMQPPSDAQRAAWRVFLDSRGQIIADAMRRALDAYIRQRDSRVYWWTTMYGADDPLLAESLPEVRSVGELRRLVRPYRFVIWELREGQSPPPIAIEFDATWERGGAFSAVIEGNTIVGFGPHLAETRPEGRERWVDVPPFGRLKQSGGTWSGLLHFEPFARFKCIADEREYFAKQREHPAFRDVPEWEFAEGNFEFEIDTPSGGDIAPSQVEAFDAFMRDPSESARTVLEAIVAHYKSIEAKCREALDPEDAERLVPEVQQPDDLRDLITFQTIRISMPNEDEPPFVGLGFACSWDEEHGLYVRCRAGVVEDVGGVDVII